jgi:hypothetical protein
MAPQTPFRITETEFITDHISHSSLSQKYLALVEAQDILQLLVDMKMFKDIGEGEEIYEVCDMEFLYKISQRVESLRVAVKDFDAFMARKVQGVQAKREREEEGGGGRGLRI